MTDLVLGLPVYASSRHRGIVWRRLEALPPNRLTAPKPHAFHAPDLTIAEVVRASAAFPGIPPLRMKIPVDGLSKPESNAASVAFLADGGLWNNLGSQAVREDRFIGQTFEDGIPRPYHSSEAGIPLFCFNGSAPVSPATAGGFQWPGLALARALFQTMQILNANTVMPRVAAMTKGIERRAFRGERGDDFDPVDLIADLRPVAEVESDLAPGRLSPEVIRATDPAVKTWHKKAARRVHFSREHESAEPDSNRLHRVLGDEPAPMGTYPAPPGFANINDMSELRQSPPWKDLVHRFGTENVSAPTTLGKIHAKLARKLIARGYLNTYLVSLHLAPLATGDIARLEDVERRLDRIVGLQA